MPMPKGRKMSPETRAKMSASAKKNWKNPVIRERRLAGVRMAKNANGWIERVSAGTKIGLDQSLELDTSAILKALANGSAASTADELQFELGIPQRRVSRALVHLKASGAIVSKTRWFIAPKDQENAA